MPFTFTKLKIPDVVLIGSKVFPDERGFFMEAYNESEFFQFGIRKRFVQKIKINLYEENQK